MDAQGEFIDVRALAAEIEDADLGIRDTTVEAGFWIWLNERKMLAIQCCAVLEE